MNHLLRLVSLAALVGTLAPAVAYFYRSIGLDSAKTAMLVATVVWFIVTPLWMGRQTQTPGADRKDS